jgi:putative ABC transport system substrate-binding protein
MKRREFIRLLGGAVAWLLAVVPLTALSPPMAWSQPPDKPRRVGVLFSGIPSDPALTPVRQALVDGLRAHGWEEGRNVFLEVRYLGTDPASFTELVADLVALNVSAILTSNTQALDAARRKTTTIPIIMAGVGSAVELGFIASLARPGGNITGLVNQIETVAEKNLELFKEIKPGIERVGIIYSPTNISSLAGIKQQQEEMAPRLGLVVLPIPVSKPADVDEAFATIVREGVQALHVHPTSAIFPHRVKIAAFAIERRLPTNAALNVMARDGLLMSYGFDSRESWRRAASYVDRTFKGANPAETPVEQVDRFQFIINLKTARAIGLDLPQALLARADEVIE